MERSPITLKNISTIEFHTGSKEELLPGFSSNFPYIASLAELDKFIGGVVPWHWHKAVELFYIETGSLEYCTPKGRILFPAGSGGLVNSNVLHMTKTKLTSQKNIQLLHLFDPAFLSGHPGSRIEQQYIMPITTATQLEVIALYPESSSQHKILQMIRDSFHLSPDDFGYEIKLRGILSDIWLELFDLSRPVREEKKNSPKANDKVKLMMIYIHEHYAQKLSISQIAASAFISERECFRVFHDCLHMTPAEYIKNYRLQIACQMLAKGRESVTFISHACGFGCSSYFGKIFRESIGYPPMEYRHKWQDNNIKGQK